MAKPISNGGGTGGSSKGGGTSYTGKTYTLTSTGIALGSQIEVTLTSSNSTLTKSNDFLYVTGTLATGSAYQTIPDYNSDVTPDLTISGAGGSDQLIFKQPSAAGNFSIEDSFFANFRSFESVKVDNTVTTDVTINLDDEAYTAGIRGAEGGAGNDTITFDDTGDAATEYNVTSVTVDGGGGVDTITTLGGDDLILVGAGDDAVGESYDGGQGADTLRVTATANLADDTLLGIETLDINDSTSSAITVTITDDQLLNLTTINKGAADLLAIDGSDGAVLLVGADGTVNIISSLTTGDTIDFSGLNGTTTFDAATDTDTTSDTVIGTVGGGADVAAVDSSGEWTFDNSTDVLSYWDGAAVQTIKLTDVVSVTASGSAVLTV